VRRAGAATLLLLAAAAAGGGAKPLVRHVFTQSGVTVTLLAGEGDAARARGFLVRAADAAEGSRYAGFRALCALPDGEAALRDFPIALVPQLREKEPRLRAFRVVTWQGAAAISELKRAELATDEPVTVRPVWKRGGIDGFEVARPAPANGGGPGARVPAPLLIRLPVDRPADEEHALVLRPRWKVAGRSISGYDVILASLTGAESGGRSPR
jgi:hypothetical protein